MRVVKNLARRERSRRETHVGLLSLTLLVSATLSLRPLAVFATTEGGELGVVVPVGLAAAAVASLLLTVLAAEGGAGAAVAFFFLFLQSRKVEFRHLSVAEGRTLV